MLDTNVIIELSRRRPTLIRERIQRAQMAGDTMAISTLVLFELHHGLAKSNQLERNAIILNGFVATELETIPFVNEDAAIAGKLRWQLESQGRRIGPYDLLIAAQALRAGMTLVTANVSEFGRVPELQWEDWTREG
ncbi:MAG: type II toxin-antitoxin system VapC family toxin [Thermomicrobiales bacterium]